MLLLTMNEWLGPGRKMPPDESVMTSVQERRFAFATALSLETAIDRIMRYQAAYNERYHLAVNFRLLQVSEIAPLTRTQLAGVQVELVEDLKQNASEF